MTIVTRSRRTPAPSPGIHLCTQTLAEDGATRRRRPAAREAAAEAEEEAAARQSERLHSVKKKT